MIDRGMAAFLGMCLGLVVGLAIGLWFRAREVERLHERLRFAREDGAQEAWGRAAECVFRGALLAREAEDGAGLVERFGAARAQWRADVAAEDSR